MCGSKWNEAVVMKCEVAVRYVCLYTPTSALEFINVILLHRWGEERFIQGFGGKQGKRPLGRPRRRGVDNIKMDLQEVGCEDMDWIDVAQDRDGWRELLSTLMNFRFP